MLRKISLGLMCAGILFSTPVLAMNHELAPNVSIDYELAANTPEVFTNFTIFTVRAVCTIKTQDESNIIHVKAINRSGEFNGRVINMGDVLDIPIHNGDKITVSAKSAAQVELTNKGAHSIVASCKTY